MRGINMLLLYCFMFPQFEQTFLSYTETYRSSFYYHVNDFVVPLEVHSIILVSTAIQSDDKILWNWTALHPSRKI